MGGRVHVVGAGLAGLAAAVGLVAAGRETVVHELAPQAGGRCRSYFEPALGLTIDNGNHLLLSANRAALSFLKTIGSEGKLAVGDEAAFAFADLATGERWVLRPNRGRVPWWIFSRRRRVPSTHAIDYLSVRRLLHPRRDASIADLMQCDGPLYHRLWRPLFLAALNTEPSEASAFLAGSVLRETLARGGSACRPLIALGGLGPAFIDPALSYLERHGATIRFRHQLRQLVLADDVIRALDFGTDAISLAPGDAVILAVPAPVAPLLLPELSVPKTFHAIVNVHFKHTPPQTLPTIIGIINGTAEWLFAFPDRISATISAADQWIGTPREALAEEVWKDVVKLTNLPETLPTWHVIRERRATFAALPEENENR
ncbi:MAG TPA: hydroxysqualene dehydroxylase HpnE, partial [Methyloceanibacter sp.]|nr:hydroxysqualene dehydroxylase HpnE [Methyloceanibacter sp.]